MKKISIILFILFSVISFSQESISHKVRSGETIYAIALKYDVKEKAIFDANPKLKGKLLQIGQVVKIPKKGKQNTEITSVPETYTVQQGDTFYGIAKKFNLSINTIQELNPTLDSRDLKVGESIVLQKQKEIVVEPPIAETVTDSIAIEEEENSNELDVVHVVKKGETLYRIAKKYNTSVATLRELNPNLQDKLPANFQLLIKKGVVAESIEEVTLNEENINDVAVSSTSALAQADFLIEKSSQYLGTRYRSGGTTSAGFDCSGLMYTTFKEIDIKLPRSSRDMANFGTRVKRKQAQKGDLIFFTTNGRGSVSHVGMIIEVTENDIKFIHSSTSSGVIISSVNEAYYKKRFVQINRVLN